MTRTPSSPWMGKHYIYAGICLIALGVFAGALAVAGGGPADSRASFLVLVGIPAGVVFVLIGVVRIIVERRRRGRAPEDG